MNKRHSFKDYITNLNCSLTHKLRESPSEQYWKNEVLRQTEGIDDIGDLKWDLVGFLALAYFILFVCLAKVSIASTIIAIKTFYIIGYSIIWQSSLCDVNIPLSGFDNFTFCWPI